MGGVYMKKDKVIYLLKGLFIAYIITVVLILIFSLLLTYTNLQENKIPLLNTIALIGSIALASIYVSIKIKEKGWIMGAIIGIVYYIILIALNFLFLKTLAMDIFSISKLILASVTGMIGGMIGINLK